MPSGEVPVIISDKRCLLLRYVYSSDMSVLYHLLIVCWDFLHAVWRTTVRVLIVVHLVCPGLGNILFQRRMTFLFKELTAFLRGDSEFSNSRKLDLPVACSSLIAVTSEGL